jgi:hypothetical protein
VWSVPGPAERSSLSGSAALDQVPEERQHGISFLALTWSPSGERNRVDEAPTDRQYRRGCHREEQRACRRPPNADAALLTRVFAASGGGDTRAALMTPRGDGRRASPRQAGASWREAARVGLALLVMAQLSGEPSSSESGWSEAVGVWGAAGWLAAWVAAYVVHAKRAPRSAGARARRVRWLRGGLLDAEHRLARRRGERG